LIATRDIFWLLPFEKGKMSPILDLRFAQAWLRAFLFLSEQKDLSFDSKGTILKPKSSKLIKNSACVQTML
jgi:hypothetical protein